MHKEMPLGPHPSLESLLSDLADLAPLMQTTQNFKLDFLLETSQFL